MPSVLDLTPVTDISKGFKDPSRHVWDAPHARVNGHRFEFNGIYTIMISEMGERLILPLLEDFGSPASTAYRCDACGERFLECDEEFDAARLVSADIRVKLNHDNLEAMYSPMGVVQVAFKGWALCKTPGCGHQAQAQQVFHIPTSYILGVIHA